MAHDTYQAIAAQAADRLGRRSDAVRFIRRGTNAVFAVHDLVLRVAPPDAALTDVAIQRHLAGWLVDNCFPTAAPVGEVMVIDDHIVTAWQRLVGRTGREGDRRDLGATVRRFHDLTAAYPGTLPPWDPLGRMAERLETVPEDEVFGASDRMILRHWRDTLVPRARALRPALPPGPLHGDIHLGNTLVATDGCLWLIDLDRICHGPREWDLAQPIASSERCGTGSLDAFMDGYGHDVRNRPGMEVLVQLRALFMTSWLLTLPRTRAVADEIRRRMAYWRGDANPPRWRPM